MRFVPPARPRPGSARPAALPLLALTLLLAIGTPADAQWKWRDKDGQINLSDRPPPKDVADKDILGRPAPAATPRAAPAPTAAASAPGVVAKAPPAGPTTPLERELETRKRTAEQEQLERQKTEEAQRTAARAENCRRARSHMAALESGQRIARMNDKGENEVLDDQTRAEETRRTREIIASDCR